MTDVFELQMLAKLGIVVLLIFPTLWGLRRLVGAPTMSGRRKAIQVLEVQPLADGQRLYLVRVQGRDLLLGGSKESLGLLAELEATEVVESADAPQSTGRDWVTDRLAAVRSLVPAPLAERLGLPARSAMRR